MRRLLVVVLVLTGACLSQKAPEDGKAAPPADQAQSPPPPPHSERVSADSLLVDLNGASKADLVALPGVGEVYAQRIIEGRPYANKTQLLSRGILPDGVYEKIRELVIARQTP